MEWTEQDEDDRLGNEFRFPGKLTRGKSIYEPRGKKEQITSYLICWFGVEGRRNEGRMSSDLLGGTCFFLTE